MPSDTGPVSENQRETKGGAAELRFYGRVLIGGYLVPVTDLRVGGDDLAAGLAFYAPDNPIVRNARGEPFVLGSTLKGVMRSNLDVIYHRHELQHLRPNAKKTSYGAIICNRQECWVCRVFGRPAHHDYREPTRLRVEDALLDPESVQQLGFEEATELSVVRTENAILRLFGAPNPRRSEYVPAGVRFKLRLVYDVYRPEDVAEGLPYVLQALHHVEDAGLGGGRSRGTGGVKFKELQLFWKSVAHYQKGDRDGQQLVEPTDGAAEFQRKCGEILKRLTDELRQEEQKEGAAESKA